MNTNYLSKGILFDGRHYFDDIKNVKFGKEIKEQLQLLYDSEVINKEALIISINSVLSQISQPPKFNIPSYYLRDLKQENINSINIFKFYDLCEQSPPCCDKLPQTSMGGSIIINKDPIIINNFKLKEEEIPLAKQYNELIIKYVDSIKELNYLMIFMKNLNDEQQYNLTLNQLTLLGF